MRKATIGISAAILLLFIGAFDADAAKISGNFCCGVAGIGWCAVPGLEDALAGCPRILSAARSSAHGIVPAPLPSPRQE